MRNKKDLTPILTINSLLFNFAAKRPMTELIKSPVFSELYTAFNNAIEKQVEKLECGWCSKKVKLSKLRTPQKIIFYQSSCCPECECKKKIKHKESDTDGYYNTDIGDKD